MSKIGRNDPCPCGSGKKFKNCHWGSNEAAPAGAIPVSQPKPPSFAELIKAHRALPILRFLAYLQVMPDNHGRNFNLENMATKALRQWKNDDRRPYLPWDALKRAILSGVGFGDEKPENLFAENIISPNGNQLVFPGIYRNGSAILNELLEVILTGDNTLPDGFKRLIHSGAGMLLFMSNQLATDLNFQRYQAGEMSDNFAFPAYDAFVENSTIFDFDQDYLEKVAKLYGYDLAVLDHFVLDRNDPHLHNEDPNNSLVSIKPLLKEDGEYIVFMPTTIVSSLISFIDKQATAFECREQLMKMLHGEQYRHVCLSLAYLGWQRTDIELPPSKIPVPFKESVWRFDNQKFAYLCYVPLAQLDRNLPFSEIMQARNNEVTAHLKSIEPETGYETLTMVVLSETGHGEFFAMSRLEGGDLYLYFTMSELTAMIYDEESDFLTLWKFAAVFKEAAEKYELPPITGLLNLYAVYRQNHGSLTDSDQARPQGSMLMILPGHDVGLKQEVKIFRDEHAAELLITGGVRAFVNVIRKRQFAPIYAFKTPMAPEYRRLLEGFKVPLWLTNYQRAANLLNNEIADALMFWLFRLDEYLAPVFEKLSFVQFEIELVLDERILNGSEFIVRSVDPAKVIFRSEVDPPKLQLHVPYDFIYLMARADNLGEKMLVKAALNGLIKYVHTAGRVIELTTEQIEEMVEAVMQPSHAKMILFTDASMNVELDGHNLPPEHFFQEADSSYVLDHLTTYLPDGYVIPKKIGSVDEKIALCDALVSGLIREITRRIAAFDGVELIKWLIKWNERCTFAREIRELRTPAKIACFAGFAQEVDEIVKHDGLLVPTAHAIRTLIEFVAANPPTGHKIPNYADVDILLALTDELTNRGSLSESMRMGLDNPVMGLLPSGRIGTSKKFQNEVLIPYALARTTGIVAGFVEKFEQRYTVNYSGKSESTPQTIEADEAFKAEFGVTITDISDVAGVLINYGFRREEPCSGLTADELLHLLENELQDKDEEVIRKSVDLMTLLRRPAIGAFPKGYSAKDIFPWRFGRNLSYIRRPLVKLENADGPASYYFGFRHLKAYFDNLLFLIFTGKLPENSSIKMDAYLGKINKEKGTPYRNEVKDWLKANTDLEVIDYEVKIEPGGHIPAHTKLGDTDVMAVDHESKTVYSLECKNLVGARNVHEMKNELDLYLGRDGKEAKAKITKHVRRDEYLKANPEQVRDFLKLGSDDYQIVSIVVAAEEMPMTYIAKEKVPLPVISFPRLKMEGKKAMLL